MAEDANAAMAGPKVKCTDMVVAIIPSPCYSVRHSCTTSFPGRFQMIQETHNINVLDPVKVLVDSGNQAS